MTRRRPLTFLLVSVLVVCGCWSSQSGPGIVSAGPYEVRLVDARTGRPLEGSVSWDFYFTSTQVDPEQRQDRGIAQTSSDGTATISRVTHPWGDSFVEVNVRADAGGYHGKRVSSNEISGTILVELEPVGR